MLFQRFFVLINKNELKVIQHHQNFGRLERKKSDLETKVNYTFTLHNRYTRGKTYNEKLF